MKFKSHILTGTIIFVLIFIFYNISAFLMQRSSDSYKLIFINRFSSKINDIILELKIDKLHTDTISELIYSTFSEYRNSEMSELPEEIIFLPDYKVELILNTENKYEMVSTIDEYCYKWDGYCGDGQWDVEEIINSDEYDGATIREMEVCKFYNDIIDNVKEFYEAKKLVLTE